MINGYDSTSEIYSYDGFSRVSSKTENINGSTFTHNYLSYDPYGRIIDYQYPSGLTITNAYDEIGTMIEMRNASNHLLYELKEVNNYGQSTETYLGNGLTTTMEHDIYGVIDRISTDDASVFDMSFDVNIKNGNLTSRTDHRLAGLTETFGYDNFNRLTHLNGSLHTDYEDNGNIKTKADVSSSSYVYNVDKIHAVQRISNMMIGSGHDQMVSRYNFAHQPVSIAENGYDLQFRYGADNNRRETTMTHQGQDVYTRYFLGDYEYESRGTDTRHVHYIGAGIMVVQDNAETPEYYYSYGDYLGSILAVTDDTGEVIARQSYDAWGRKRSANDWANYHVLDYELPWLYRGYTGHEMLMEFDIINMNGRLYDPIIGRMLSPDNYSGQDGTSQSYNRYSYALNNPLKYTDPDGENPLIAFAIGAAINTGVHAINGGGSFDSFLGAAVTGGISGVVGYGIGTAFGGSSFLLRAGVHGVHGAAQSYTFGGNPLTGFATGAFGSAFAHAVGDQFAQSTLGVAAGGAVGGAFGAIITKSNVLEGAGRGLIIALVNDAMHSAFNGGGQDPDPPTAKSIILKIDMEFNGKVITHYITEAFGLVGSGATLGGYVLSDGKSYLAFNQVKGKFEYISKARYFNKIYGGNASKINILAEARNLGMVSKIFGAVSMASIFIGHKEHKNYYYSGIQTVHYGISSFAPGPISVPWTIGTFIGVGVTNFPGYQEYVRPWIRNQLPDNMKVE